MAPLFDTLYYKVCVCLLVIRVQSAFNPKPLSVHDKAKLLWDGEIQPNKFGLSFNTTDMDDDIRWYTVPNAYNFQYTGRCTPEQPRVILELAGNYRSFTQNTVRFKQWFENMIPKPCWAITVACWNEVEANTPAWWGGGGTFAEQYNKEGAAAHLKKMELVLEGRLIWAVVDDKQKNVQQSMARGRQSVLWAAAHELVHLALPLEFRDPSVLVFKSRPDAIPNNDVDITDYLKIIKKQPYSVLMLTHAGSMPNGLDPSEIAWVGTVASQNEMCKLMRVSWMIEGSGYLTAQYNWERDICCGEFARAAYGGISWSITRMTGSGASLGEQRSGVYNLAERCSCVKARCIKDPYTQCKPTCNVNSAPMTHLTAAAEYNIVSQSCSECLLGDPFPNCDALTQYRQPAGRSMRESTLLGEARLNEYRKYLLSPSPTPPPTLPPAEFPTTVQMPAKSNTSREIGDVAETNRKVVPQRMSTVTENMFSTYRDLMVFGAGLLVGLLYNRFLDKSKTRGIKKAVVVGSQAGRAAVFSN